MLGHFREAKSMAGCGVRIITPYSVCRRQRAGWRFHDHIAEMANMLNLSLNAIASCINSGGLRFYTARRSGDDHRLGLAGEGADVLDKLRHLVDHVAGVVV